MMALEELINVAKGIDSVSFNRAKNRLKGFFFLAQF
jgi:hypothetical protein